MGQAALNADFGGAHSNSFYSFCRHLLRVEKIGVGFTRSAAEGAKLTAHKADIREIDIAIDHVRDQISDQIAP